jgi:hypothetical protein
MKSYIRNLTYCFIASLACSSCSRHPSQQAMEAQTLKWVDKWVQLYEVRFPGVTITNLEQVYHGLNRSYPHSVHDDFKPYGKYAGFNTSFFEKYVFFSPGTTSRWAEGEVVYMNAQPFPLSTETGMGRKLVLRNATVRQRTMNEELIKEMLAENGVKPLPLGSISPRPGQTLEPEVGFHLRLHDKFVRVCYNLGLGVEATAHLWRIAVWSPILLLALASLWFWRRSRPKHQ